MALQLALGSVNHANSPFQPLVNKLLAGYGLEWFPEREQEVVGLHCMKQILITVSM